MWASYGNDEMMLLNSVIALWTKKYLRANVYPSLTVTKFTLLA